MRTPPRPEAVARRREGRLKDRLQYLMQCLLNQAIHHRRNAQRTHPALRLGNVHPAYRHRPVSACQQSGPNPRPVPFQMILELGHSQLIHSGCALVLDHPLIRELEVAAFHHDFHQARCRHLRFGPRTGRHVGLGASRSVSRNSVRLSPRPPDLPDQLLPSSASVRVPPPTRGTSCSALRLLLTPTMASADFWRCIPAPLDVGSTRHTARSPRVWRTHLHAYACRIYVIAFRASIGLRPSLPPHPTTPPLSASCSSGQRFALSFLRIRSRPRHPCPELTLLLAECVEDFHLQVRAPCRAHKEKSPASRRAFPAMMRCVGEVTRRRSSDPVAGGSSSRRDC